MNTHSGRNIDMKNMNISKTKVWSSKRNNVDFAKGIELNQWYRRKSMSLRRPTFSVYSGCRKTRGLRYEINLMPLFLGLLNPLSKVYMLSYVYFFYKIGK